MAAVQEAIAVAAVDQRNLSRGGVDVDAAGRIGRGKVDRAARAGGFLNQKIGRNFVPRDHILEGFRRAFTGVDLARLRRCPVCTGFYYALRANKGACDKHVGLARIWKIRQKTPEYRERWRNKRLVKQGRMMEPFIDENPGPARWPLTREAIEMVYKRGDTYWYEFQI